jgi:hypothetical protein
MGKKRKKMRGTVEKSLSVQGSLRERRSPSLRLMIYIERFV